MSWLIFALLGAFFWSLVHHLDKIILGILPSGRGVGSIVVISSLFPILAIPFLWYFGSVSPFSLPLLHSGLLMLSGVIGALAALCYFYALEDEETSVVVSLYQLSPVFGYIFGIMFLGEVLTPVQIIGALVTVLGVTILSVEFIEERTVRIRGKATALMVTASLLYALGDVVYKDVTVEAVPYLTAMGWVFVGYVFFGIAALAGIQEYRQSIYTLFRVRTRGIMGLNGLNEVLQIGGLMATAYALLLAPVAMVLVIDAYQPVLVFLIGIALTYLAPSFVKENLSTHHLIHKGVAIGVAVLGTVLLHGA